MKAVSASSSCVILAGVLLCGGATCFGASEPAVKPNLEDVRPVLGPGDLVEVRVFGEEDLSGEHRISADGEVELPLVKAVAVNGLAPQDAAERIASAYNERFLKNAQVTVFVKESVSRKVIVLGQVEKPGAYPYEQGMTVIVAIARAGGTSKLADANRTMVTRENQGEQTRSQVKVADIQRGDRADVALQPGDIVFVPELLF